MNKPALRRPEISGLNSLLCLMVVWIHAASETISHMDTSGWQYCLVMTPWRLCAFAVQGFFLLSGVKLCLGQGKTDWRRFYRSRLLKIVVPYLLWVVIYYLYFVWRHYFPFSLGDLVGYILRGDLVGHLYFVIALVQFYALAPLGKRLTECVHPCIGIPLALIVTVLMGQFFPQMLSVVFPNVSFAYNDRLFTTYLVYWVAGCYIGRYYDTFTDILRGRSRHTVTAGFAVTAVFETVFSWLQFSGRAYVPFLEYLHYAYVICALLFFYAQAIRWYDRRQPSPQMQTFDTYTYLIYLSHCLVIFITNALLARSGLPMAACYLIRILSAYGVTVSGVFLWKRFVRCVKDCLSSHRRNEA